MPEGGGGNRGSPDQGQGKKLVGENGAEGSTRNPEPGPILPIRTLACGWNHSTGALSPTEIWTAARFQRSILSERVMRFAQDSYPDYSMVRASGRRSSEARSACPHYQGLPTRPELENFMEGKVVQGR